MLLAMHLGEVLSSQQLFFAHHFTLIRFTLTPLPLTSQKLLLPATDTTSLRTREGVR